MNQRLIYRRQFLLTNSPITWGVGWACLKLDQYCIYTHPDLEINHSADLQKIIVLIGDLYDSEEPEKGNVELLNDIMVKVDDKDSLFLKIKKYVGNYLILFIDAKNVIMFSDARSVREIYYCTDSNHVICGSQPNLIAEVSCPKIKPTQNPDLLDFYKKHMKDSAWIGDETFYESVKHLLPNHYLDINRREVVRYWPNEPIKLLGIEEAVSKSCKYLQGIMKAITHRHSVMMAVTSGTDSRTLLAASRSVKDKIHYFVNDSRKDRDHPDISIPTNIFKSIEGPFHVYNVPEDVDDDFRNSFLKNTFLASEDYLPAIYHIFYLKHSERICVLGVGEIGRTFYGKDLKKLDGHRIADKLGYSQSSYAIIQGERYISEIIPIAKKFNINPMIMLYWEQRLGNWGATRNSESLIAIDKIDPFNGHLLNEIFLGVDEKHKNYHESPCTLFREMIRNMWPDLLEWPINPKYIMRDKITAILRKSGLHSLLKEIRYQLNYLRYLYKI